MVPLALSLWRRASSDDRKTWRGRSGRRQRGRGRSPSRRRRRRALVHLQSLSYRFDGGGGGGGGGGAGGSAVGRYAGSGGDGDGGGGVVVTGMAGRCCCSDSRATQLAAVYGLVVGIVWGTLSILALLAYTCVLPAFEQSVLWLVYFYDPACGWQPPAFLEQLAPGWPGDEGARPAARRTRDLAAARLSLAAFRLLASAALLVAERRQSSARREGLPPPTCFPVYFACLLAAVLDVVLDTVFIPYYSFDLSESKGARNIMHLLGVSTVEDSWQWELPAWVTATPALPPALLLVLGSRGAPFVWLAEGAVVARVAGAARRLHTQRRRHLRQRSVRVSQRQVPSTSSLSPEPSAGPSAASTPLEGAALPPSAQPLRHQASDSDDDDVLERPKDDGPQTPDPGGRSQRARLSLLGCLAVPGGAGDRRWSYVPLATQPVTTVPPGRRRPASQPPA